MCNSYDGISYNELTAIGERYLNLLITAIEQVFTNIINSSLPRTSAFSKKTLHGADVGLFLSDEMDIFPV